MKKVVFLVLFMLTVFISAKAQILQSYYFVGDIKIERVMLNLTEKDRWEPYHMIERDRIRILFLNPERDFTTQTLNTALNKWERIASQELELVVLFNNKLKESDTLPTFQFFPEDIVYIFHNAIYAIGRVEWEERNSDNPIPLSKQMY